MHLRERIEQAKARASKQFKKSMQLGLTHSPVVRDLELSVQRLESFTVLVGNLDGFNSCCLGGLLHLLPMFIRASEEKDVAPIRAVVPESKEERMHQATRATPQI